MLIFAKDFFLLGYFSLGVKNCGLCKTFLKGASALGPFMLFILLSLGILFTVKVSGLMAVLGTVGSD